MFYINYPVELKIYIQKCTFISINVSNALQHLIKTNN